MAKTRNRDPRRVKKSQSKHPNKQVTQPPHHQDRWDVTRGHYRQGEIPAGRKELRLRQQQEKEFQRRRQIIQQNSAANLAARRRSTRAWLYPLLILLAGAAAILFSQSR